MEICVDAGTPDVADGLLGTIGWPLFVIMPLAGLPDCEKSEFEGDAVGFATFGAVNAFSTDFPAP